jgi:sec-independent protein translocase protein TatB
MFEIGFSEVLLIFVIALVVLGPEKLPKLAAQVGRWAGRAKSMARQFREQLESEVDLEQTLTPRPKPKAEPPPPASEAPAAAVHTADDYSAAHDPASEAYATPAQDPLRDHSEDPPAVAPVPDPGAPAPVPDIPRG